MRINFIREKENNKIFKELVHVNSRKLFDDYMSMIPRDHSKGLEFKVVINEFIAPKKMTVLLRLLYVNNRLRSDFQHEDTYLAVLDGLFLLDALSKQFSLQVNAKKVPLYPIDINEEINENVAPTSALECILKIRLVHFKLAISLAMNYKNAPISIILKLFSIAANKYSTYGLRRAIPFLIREFSYCPENCYTIINGGGLLVLKYYDALRYEHGYFERQMVNSLLAQIKRNSPKLQLDKLTPEYRSLFQSEAKSHTVRTFARNALAISSSFLFTFYYTNNFITSTVSAILIPLSNQKIDAFNIRRSIVALLSNFASARFIPLWEINKVVSYAATWLETIVSSLDLMSHNIYTEKQLDESVPSIESIERGSLASEIKNNNPQSPDLANLIIK
ncbi:hypothetical protein PPL_11403 [Heterostelium album PN500]|uniref:Uncharacterized protein n=1 Tax=Heterostelium pallidum (strain ATCC 26659 / Pp 5 / PN500) TaxID=670386 RepID=D3BTB0_HETP5|nr:hypothetical protein PPL_11403 [Heterostelium album PN500]EFA75327.1 hypothetical protein PPL_11403 [Heterostelium album PN500]|eukprot:XP_020427461.1 hypothetical protein PPL_11403 [Heterostelium album PN500]